MDHLDGDDELCSVLIDREKIKKSGSKSGSK